MQYGCIIINAASPTWDSVTVYAEKGQKIRLKLYAGTAGAGISLYNVALTFGANPPLFPAKMHYLAGTDPVANATRLLFVQTASVTVTNTTDNISIVGTGVGSKSIPASTLKVGDIVRFSVRGFYATNAGGEEITFRVYIDGSTLVEEHTVTLGSTGDADWAFGMEIELTVRTAGPSGKMLKTGKIYRTLRTTYAEEVYYIDSTTEVDVDTTDILIPDAAVAWTAAKLTNVVKCIYGKIEILTV